MVLSKKQNQKKDLVIENRLLNTRNFSVIFSVILSISLLLFFGLVEPKKCQAKVPITYSADSLIFTNNNLGPIRYYYNKVKLSQGKVSISCDFAKFFLETNSSELSGNVILSQDDLLMSSPFAKYDGNTKISNAWGGVKITQGAALLKANSGDYFTETQFAVFKKDVFLEDDTLKLYADLLNYYRNVSDIESYGNVLLFGKKESVILSTDTLIRGKISGQTSAFGRVVLYKIDTLRQNENDNVTQGVKLDTTKINAAKIQIITSENQNIYTFSGGVKIASKGITSISDSVFYDKEQGIIKLIGNPIVWYQENQLYGDTIVIQLNNDILQKISAIGNALTVSLPDNLDSSFNNSSDSSFNNSFINQMSGNNIDFSFVESLETGKTQINLISSTGQAKSLYFLSNQPGKADLKSNTSGKIEFLFTGGKPDKVYWIDDISGTVYPYNIIKDNIKSYYLPNFRWTKNKPELQEIKNRP